MWGTPGASGHNKLSKVHSMTPNITAQLWDTAINFQEHNLAQSRLYGVQQQRARGAAMLLSGANCPRQLQWDKKHQLQTVDEWKEVVWSDKSWRRTTPQRWCTHSDARTTRGDGPITYSYRSTGQRGEVWYRVEFFQLAHTPSVKHCRCLNVRTCLSIIATSCIHNQGHDH